MYLDTSFRKIASLAVIGVILASLVAWTFVAKENAYGTTPFYSSVGLAWQQITGHIAYPLERALRAFFGGRASGAAAQKGEAAAIPVITYHRLVEEADGANVTFNDFKDHMEALKAAGWDTVTLADYEAFMRGELALPERSVLLTFDDGAKQSYYPVDPILKELDFNAVNYIIVGDSVRPETTYYLSPQEIRNMLETSRWEIGSHSYAGHHAYAVDALGREGHFFSDKLWLAAESRIETNEEFRERVLGDLQRSKADLESAYGVTVRGFAFPFGDTGETSVNYPESHAAVIAAADEVYEYAWVQPGRGEFTYNYPHEDGFLMRRIKAAPGWSGEDLVAALERGLGKPVPYRAALAQDIGWVPTWGAVRTLPDGTLFSASPELSGASAFIDGTAHWQNYEARVTGDWNDGFAVLMAGLSDATHYRDCAFSDGLVSIRQVAGDERRTLAHERSANIRRGENVELGIRIQGGIVQCLYNGRVVADARGLSPARGGIGIQVWSEELDSAEFLAKELSVTDISRVRLAPPVAASPRAAPTSPAIPSTNETADETPETPAPIPGPELFSTGPVAAPPPDDADPEEIEREPAEEDRLRRDRDDSIERAQNMLQDIMNAAKKERENRRKSESSDD